MRSLARRWPFLTFFLLGVLSNAAGSLFSFVCNELLILDTLTPGQRAAFWGWVAPAYNVVAYPVGLGVLLWLLWPLSRSLHDLRDGRSVPAEVLQQRRRTLINLPLWQAGLNLLCWLPGALVFPLGIGLLGGWHGATQVWTQFGVSFLVTSLFTTVQTFFILESVLIELVYPDFFRDARPAQVPGTVYLPLGGRLGLYWVATAVVPVLALLAVALNFTQQRQQHFESLRGLALGVAVGSILCSAVIAMLVGRSLVGWVAEHAAATTEITHGNYAVHIATKRPDEFGRLTDRFNDMAHALEQAREMRDRFGHFFRPDVRDTILRDYPGLGGDVEEITVLFADIRGFTHRSEDESPERVVALLERFFTLVVKAVEEEGWVNKFLGDGVMALFGWPDRRDDHADCAVRSALRLQERLTLLNRELTESGQAPLAVGVGIHSGPALVGCVGATLAGEGGQERLRCEMTAIGRTVNLGQRVEQLTKTVGGPVLLTEQTRSRLQRPVPLTCLGQQRVSGSDEPLMVYRVDGESVLPAHEASRRAE